jgi:hypothetical protein
VLEDMAYGLLGAVVQYGLTRWQQMQPCSILPATTAFAAHVIVVVGSSRMPDGMPKEIAEAIGYGTDCLPELRRISIQGCRQLRGIG